MKLALLSTFAFVVTQVLARPAPGCLQNYTGKLCKKNSTSFS
jgi:hypothetical protein